ncbi:unnamed protein product [Rotaria sordida]|uniref:MULE transposase domain-containing protein n=1 Tax=Rotaria sordida TaxID=392033 RepID=A0A815B587_9BILA|nr:unnamed protein product [Rotaria sordida]CAF1545592.1 unnamed protein product [Rotaria sordida]
MYLIVDTTKRKKCLLFDEYRYLRDHIRNTTTYWRCEKLTGCPGRAIQRGDEPPVISSPHNHDPNKEQNEIIKFKSDIKFRIREEQVPLKQLYRSELIKRYTINPNDVRNLPQFHQIKTSLYRVKNENYPPLPRSINEVSIEGKWRMSMDNKDFILVDHVNPRFLTFGTQQSLHDLCALDHIFLDGTFKSCPDPFAQLYTVHIQSSILNSTVPVLYSLLPNKTKNMYKLFFNELRTVTVKHDLVLNPRFITVDFEQGAISALKHIFPGATLKGCNFHYNQCLFKKIQELGLQKDYYDSSPDDPTSVKSLFKQTAALTFMPMSEINDLWCGIMDKFDHIPHAQEFFDYFTETWVDEGCLFPKTLWNYYNFDGPRTTNGLEGWHHRLNSNIGTTNPNLYVVIEELKKDYAFNMATLKQLENNTNKPPRKKQFIFRNQRIMDLMTRYGKGALSLEEYFVKMCNTISTK